MDAVEKVYRFYESYAGEKQIIGKSVCGQPLVAMFAGEHKGPQIIVQCAIHAREWITALLALEQLECGVLAGGAWFMPLTNPDGAALSIRGEAFLHTVPPCRAAFLRRVNGGEDFSLWKANANAVDLNVNFPADWGRGISNVRIPSPENYIGPSPFSEPETRALRDFTRQILPAATLSFHTKGEEIYWYYGQSGNRLERDRALAFALAEETGYAAGFTEGSCGGYKDWCIRELRIPSFTVEVGRDAAAHPLQGGELPQIAEKNVRLPSLLLELLAYE